MASEEIQNQVKQKLFETWMPDKPGGLKGLVNMAADAALAVLGERVEFLEGELEASAALLAYEIEAKLEPDTDLEPGDDSDDAEQPSGLVTLENGNQVLSDDPRLATGELVARQEPEVDQTKYTCPQCAVVHQRDSGVGTRHAHLFYGGPAAIVHLEYCPKLEDPVDGTCNCNAEPLSAAARAQGRREL